jgi:hypothetical protein
MYDWHTSTYSQGHGGNCVEVAESPQAVHVRDTRHREEGALVFPSAEWHAFLAEVERL